MKNWPAHRRIAGALLPGPSTMSLTCPRPDRDADPVPRDCRAGAREVHRQRCHRPGCRHAPSRHVRGSCSCGCSTWSDRWPHWWRDLAVSTWFCADQAWQLEAEAEALGYESEMEDFRRDHPRPTFKRILLDLKGIGVEE